jgi:RES domain-containing protein
LIPAQFADGGRSVLARLTEDDAILNGIFELDNATNDRLLAESGLAPGIDVRELVFGIPSYRIINAAFCHPAPNGSRFNSPDRGAWYAGFELETSQAEVAYHRRLWLAEVEWEEEEVADYVDYVADFRAEFHDLRKTKKYAECLSPICYKSSQAIAAQLFESGSAGIVYPCVRRKSGTCVVCFRPVLVSGVRLSGTFQFVFPNSRTSPRIRQIS